MHNNVNVIKCRYDLLGSHSCLSDDTIQIISYVVKIGAHKESVLIRSTRDGHESIVRYLIDNGANVDDDDYAALT